MHSEKCSHSFSYTGTDITLSVDRFYYHECTKCGEKAILSKKMDDYLMITKLQLKRALVRQPKGFGLEALWGHLKKEARRGYQEEA